jgi:outer membrane protein assembly factor BamB
MQNGFVNNCRTVAAGVSILVSVLNAHAENWPQWRGPNGDGISSETSVPAQWGTSQNVAWKTRILGEGHSSPVVFGNNVFLTTATKDGQRYLLRIDTSSGNIVWQRIVLSAAVESMHRENSPASSTPVTDGTYVFTSFQNGSRVDLQCYDYSGERIWSVQPLQFRGMHGYSYTPVLFGELVIYDFSQNDESAVIALDKKTGQQRWRFTHPKQEISHVTPIIVKGARPQLVVCGGDYIRSFEPTTGQPIWSADGPTDVCVAGLSFGDETVFANGGYPKKTRMAVKTTGSGDVTASHLAWSTSREVTYVPSPVYSKGHLYTVVDDGLLYCFEAKSGDAVWNHRIGGRFRSSLVLAAGNVYATNDKGLTTVFRATPEKFIQVASNNLAEFCYATPAISNGRIYVRTGSNLYCISGPGTPPPRSVGG